MMFSRLSFLFLSASLSIPALGYQLNCVRDERAQDGDLTQVVAQIQDKGVTTVTIREEGASPADSHKEEATIRALTCSTPSQPGQISIACTGLHKFSVDEFAGQPSLHPGLPPVIVIKTSFPREETFTFKKGPIGTAPIKNGCDVTP